MAAAAQDCALFLDMDLAILGSAPAAFDAYEQAVRREYDWVSEPQWIAGRRAVLAGFLARPAIYATAAFRATHEAAARRNLAEAMARLDRYSHKDEPEKPRDGEIQWLSFVRTYLQPAVKNGVFDLWVDRHMTGGADWEPEIERKLRACDIFILLVSAYSMASELHRRQGNRDRPRAAGEGRGRPFLSAAADADAQGRARQGPRQESAPARRQALLGFSAARSRSADDGRRRRDRRTSREQNRGARKSASDARSSVSDHSPPTSTSRGLPETAYERLVGRDAELKRLDEAWADRQDQHPLARSPRAARASRRWSTNGSTRLQADSYRGAECVLGWSFYSQGSKERATSADEFLNWALDKLGVKLETTSASAKGEAIAEALTARRVLLVLDGVEPLQHGPGSASGPAQGPGPARAAAPLRRRAAGRGARPDRADQPARRSPTSRAGRTAPRRSSMSNGCRTKPARRCCATTTSGGPTRS